MPKDLKQSKINILSGPAVFFSSDQFETLGITNHHNITDEFQQSQIRISFRPAKLKKCKSGSKGARSDLELQQWKQKGIKLISTYLNADLRSTPSKLKQQLMNEKVPYKF